MKRRPPRSTLLPYTTLFRSRGFEHPIAIARTVMETLPHVLIVGAGAERFAREAGFPERELRTPEALAVWRERLERRASSEVHTSELQSRQYLVCRLLLETKS